MVSPNLGQLERFELVGNNWYTDWAIPLSISPYLTAELRENFLWKLRTPELKKAAARVKLKGRSKLKRVELIEALKAHPMPHSL